MSKWEWKKLGEVCEIARGGSPRPIKEYITSDADGINWIKIGDTDPTGKYIFSTEEKIKPSGIKKSRYVESGDFLLSNSMSFGRPYILKTNGCIHDGWLVLKNYQKYLDVNFFYHLLSSPIAQEQFDQEAKGSTVRNLNTDIVSKVYVPIPPLSEQKRIVKFLDEEFSKIDTLKTNAETNLKNAKELFESKIEESYSEKNSWKNIKLEDLVSCDCSLGYGIVQPGDEFPNGIPVVRPVDLTTKYVTRHNLKHVDPRISDGYKRTILKGGELLFCVRGTTGVVSIASAELNGCNVTRGISPLRFDNLETALYVYYYFQTKKASEEIKSKTKGTALKQINISDLRNISIPLPPLSVQKEIVARLDKLSENVKRLEANYKQITANCDELKKSILKKTFEGKS